MSSDRLAATCVVLGTALVPDERDEDRSERWREDVAFLGRELAAKHLNLFHSLPREEFEAEIADLTERVEDLTDAEIAAEIQRIVVRVGDAHTTVQHGSPPFRGRATPIDLDWFEDGVRLLAAPSEHADAIGGRLTAVGGVAIDEAWKRASGLIAHENEAWLRAQTPKWLTAPAFLHALGLADDEERAQFTFEIEGGGTRELDLRAGAQVTKLARAEPEPRPPWIARREESYWFQWLAESRTLHLQYNRCADDPKKPFAELVQELLETADREKPDRLLVDLRWNGGGNSMVISPLFGALGSRRGLRERGRLFVAIGRHTFSSGMMNAGQFADTYGAILVGEPTGGKPNAYGEVRTLELPHSKIKVGYCTKLFRRAKEDPPSIEPHVAVPLTFEDWKTGRDPVLEAILRCKPDEKSR